MKNLILIVAIVSMSAMAQNTSLITPKMKSFVTNGFEENKQMISVTDFALSTDQGIKFGAALDKVYNNNLTLGANLYTEDESLNRRHLLARGKYYFNGFGTSTPYAESGAGIAQLDGGTYAEYNVGGGYSWNVLSAHNIAARVKIRNFSGELNNVFSIGAEYGYIF